MTTKLEMQQKIVKALWQAEIECRFTDDGIVAKTNDSDEYQITIQYVYPKDN